MTGRKNIALLEALLIAFIIGIFILSATQTAMFVVAQSDLKTANYKKTLDTYSELRRSYNDFESSFVGYLAGAGTVKQEQLRETFAYFRNFTDLGPLSETQIKVLDAEKAKNAHKFKAILSDMSKAIDQLKISPTAEADAKLRKEFVNLNQSMPQIAKIYMDSQNEIFAAQLRREHIYLLLSIVCMSGAGLGLILLLLLKLSLLQKLSADQHVSQTLSTARLAAIEAAGDGIGLVDPQGNLFYMNQALMKLHDIPAHEAHKYIGQSWHNLYTEKGRQIIMKKVMPMLGRLGYWKGDAPIARRNGEIVWAEMSLTMLPDGGLIGTASDISERKRNEQERDDLQKQIYQAQKMEAIGRLAGGIAHDFNNILASILGYAEFLTDDLKEQSPEHLFASRIRSGGLQARQLVEQLLSFSRPQEGLKEIIDLRDIAEEARDMLEAGQPSSVSIETACPDKPVLVNGNATQLGQILVNLGLNATDAMDQQGVLYISVHEAAPAQSIYTSIGSPTGGLADRDIDTGALPYKTLGESDGTVRAWLGSLRSGQSYVRVRVADAGCGMTEQIVEHIFEPFYTTKSVDRGTGLGLSSVHGLLAAHKGVLALHTRVGKGTTFDLFLPAAPSDAVLKPPPTAISRMLGHGRILIVEDDPDVRTMIELMVKRLGYEATSCDHGLSAIDTVREEAGDFDLIVSDYMMPDMTGVDMADQIAPDFPKLPVLILSGYSKDKMTEIMEAHPSIRAVMSKPVDSATLSQKIRSIMEDRKH